VGKFSDRGARVESISFAPGVPDTGDIEGATTAIDAVAEAVGLGNADYIAGLLLPVPVDARVHILRIAARLAVTIDSFNLGCTLLRCRVYADAQDDAHRLFDITWNAIGAKLEVVDTHSGALATIFGLLGDGAGHTFYFYFWVDAGNAVISLVELWEGIGTSATLANAHTWLRIDFVGQVTLISRVQRIGTGNPNIVAVQTGAPDLYSNYVQGTGDFFPIRITMVWNNDSIDGFGTVATDINCLFDLRMNLRSEG